MSQEKLITVHCATCTIAFGLTELFLEKREKYHIPFYCPVGHGNIFRKKTENEKMVKEKRGKLEVLFGGKVAT